MPLAIEDDSNAAGELPPPEHQSPPPPRLSQSRLHNFSFPNWGDHKLLRCSNFDLQLKKKDGKKANEQEPSSVARPRRRKAEATEPASKVTVALSHKEIEEDFMLVAGVKPSRRRKKRPPAVQKKLDDLFPGLQLSGITLDRYKTKD